MWGNFSTEFQEFKELIEGNGEMSQLLRALAALVEGLSLVSQIKELTTACNSSPRGYPMISPVLCRDSHVYNVFLQVTLYRLSRLHIETSLSLPLPPSPSLYHYCMQQKLVEKEVMNLKESWEGHRRTLREEREEKMMFLKSQKLTMC